MSRPYLLEYGAEPNWGVTERDDLLSSADALEAARWDANARKTTIKAPVGRFLCERDIGPFIHSGIQGEWTGPDALDDATGLHGLNNSVILIPAGPNQLQPWATFASGTGIKNITGLYVDVTAASSGITVTRDEAGLVTALEGSPPEYAPFIKSEHRYHDNGNLLPGGNTQPAGRLFIEDIRALGAYIGIYIRDDHPSNQKGTANVRIANFSGFCTNKDIVIGRNTGLSAIETAQTSEGLWKEAGGDPQHRLAAHRRAHGYGVELTNRAVGLRIDNLGTRDAKALIHLVGGGGAIAAHPDYDGPYLGNPSGKFNGLLVTRSGGEQVRHMLLVEPDAYVHRSDFWFGGRAIDDQSADWAGATVQIDTDKNVAGFLNGEGVFRTMGQFTGWAFNVTVNTQESDGPLIYSGPNDGHSQMQLAGLAAGNAQKTPDGAAIVIAEGSTLRIDAAGLRLVTTKRSAQTVADVPEPYTEHLDLRNSRLDGFAMLLLDDYAPRADDIIGPTTWRQTTSTLDEDDDAED